MPPGGETVGCHMIRVLDSAGSTLVEWGQQQQQQQQEGGEVKNVEDDQVCEDEENYVEDDEHVNSLKKVVRHMMSRMRRTTKLVRMKRIT